MWRDTQSTLPQAGRTCMETYPIAKPEIQVKTTQVLKKNHRDHVAT